MNRDAIRRFLMFLSSAVDVERSQLYQLIHSAEAGFYLREVHTQLEIGLALQAFGYPFNQVGKYYESVYLYRTGQFDKARKLLECVAESAPARYRSKAMLSLSAVEARIGHFEESLRLRLHTPSADDPLIALEAQQSVAVLRSIAGEHQAALRDLERLWPLARIVGRRGGHPAYFTFLNSYALELSEAGRTEEAEQVSGVLASSPLINRYPEWQETVAEVAAKQKRSPFIAVPHELDLKYFDTRVQAAVDYLKANLQHKLDLETIAREVGISQSHFSRVFKDETGYSPIDYLIKLRLELAAYLLRTKFTSIKEVLTATGFDGRANFGRLFKERFGMTASAYKKRFGRRPRRR